MTPEEKALDLTNKMYMVIPAHPDGGKIEYETAVDCAIICAEAILASSSDFNVTVGRNGLSDKEYWTKVLEILKAKREPEKTTIQQQPEKKTGLQSPGLWYARLEGCKTPEDVDELEKKHSDAINANPDLRRLFVIYKFRLKNK